MATPMTDHCNPSFQRRRHARGAVSTLEVFVSATLLIAIMGVMGPAVSSLHQIQRHSKQYQFATNEVINKIVEIQHLPESNRLNAIAALERAEETIQSRLVDARWQSQLIQSEDGTQCRLSLEWKSRFHDQSVALTFWPTPNLDLDRTAAKQKTESAP